MIRIMFITLFNHQNFVKFSFDTEKGDWPLKLGTKRSLKFFLSSHFTDNILFDVIEAKIFIVQSFYKLSQHALGNW